MKQVTEKAYAKLNISLNITGNHDGYHTLDTIVTTVNKYDTVTVTKRKDDKILVSYYGKYPLINYIQANTNAYKAAEMFKNEYNTCGVNVDVYRYIPEGSGMGGSSADICGVLLAMKKLFNIDCDLKPMADKLGSDSGYLLEGGYARLLGRGEIVEKLDSDLELFFVVIYSKYGVNTKECFKMFDDKNYKGILANNDEIVNGIINKDLSKFKNNCQNALYLPAIEINEDVKANLQDLQNLSPIMCGMTGSGSTVFAMFESLEMAKWAESKLKRKHYNNVEVLKSYNKNEKTLIERIKSIFSPITDEELKK